MILHRTAAGEGSAELTIEKSRFIAHVRPVETRQEADEFIASVKKKYKDATHNVPALVLGDRMQIQWASDDGEPQGTSGAPMVQMLVSENISNVVIVVTRYFGGIKLGTGGLVRAYTNSARAGLEAAGICSVKEMTLIRAVMDYSYLGKFQNMEKNGLYLIDDVEYGEKVCIVFACDRENADKLGKTIENITTGTAEIEDREDVLRRVF